MVPALRTALMLTLLLFAGCASPPDQADPNAQSANDASPTNAAPAGAPEDAGVANRTEDVHFDARYNLLLVDQSGEQASSKTTSIPTALVGAPVSIRATMDWDNGLAPLRVCLVEFRGPSVGGVPCIEGVSPLAFDWSGEHALADGAYDFEFSSPSGPQAVAGLRLVAEATILAGTADDS